MAKIYVRETERLNALLTARQGRATTRTLTATEVQGYVKEAEVRLTAVGVAKGDFKDVKIVINPVANRQPTAGAYKYHADATEVVVEKNSVGWFVSSVARKGALFDTKANASNFFLDIPKHLEAKVVNTLVQAQGLIFTESI